MPSSHKTRMVMIAEQHLPFSQSMAQCMCDQLDDHIEDYDTQHSVAGHLASTSTNGFQHQFQCGSRRCRRRMQSSGSTIKTC